MVPSVPTGRDIDTAAASCFLSHLEIFPEDLLYEDDRIDLPLCPQETNNYSHFGNCDSLLKGLLRTNFESLVSLR